VCAEIRAVEEADVATLEAQHPEGGRPSSRHAERWTKQLHGGGVALVAWEAERALGWIFLDFVVASDRGRVLLVDLWVAEEARNSGIGAGLLEAAIARSAERGAAAVELTVTTANPYNDAARRLYARRGFVAEGEPFEDGYFYWTSEGERQWDGETHQRLVLALG
jgi:GNAT superfamily N-acetyltransferase